MYRTLEGGGLSKSCPWNWEKDVWNFQAKSGTSGSCPPFSSCPRRIAVQHKSLGKGLEVPDLSGHYSRDWSEYVNMIGAIGEPFLQEGEGAPEQGP